MKSMNDFALDEKKARLALLKLRQLQPLAGGCIAELSGELLRAESSLLALEITRSESRPCSFA